MKLTKKQEIVKLLFKDFLTSYNSRSMSKVVGMSHAGSFKIMKKLEKEGIVISKRIGKAVIYSLDIENPLTCREVETALTIEAQNYKRWIEEFNSLKDKVRFVILFGSILEKEKSARDIDLFVLADKNKFNEVKKAIEEKNKFLSKRIHLVLQFQEEFKHDLNKKNKVTLEIIKKGVVLFGQEELTKILGELLR